MFNSTVTYRTKFVFFQPCARALTTSHQTNFGYIAQSPRLFTIMPNLVFVALPTLPDIFVQAFCDLQSVTKVFISGELHRVLKLILRHKASFWLFKNVKCYQISQYLP